MANFGKILSGFLGFKKDEEPQKQEPVKEPETNDNEFTMSEEALKDKTADNASESYGVMAQKEENKPITFGGQEGAVEKPAEKAAIKSQPTEQTAEDEEYNNAFKQYKELIELLKGEKAKIDAKYNEDEDKKKQRERAEKSAMFVSRLSDVADVMLQAYNHSRGFQSVPTTQNASDKTYQRILQSRREMEGYRQQGLNISKAIADLEGKMVSMKQARDRQARLDKETEIKQQKAEAYRGYYEAMANKNNEMAAYYKAKAEALEEGKSLEEALKLAKIAKENASKEKINAGTEEINERRERASQPKVVETREVNTNAKGKTEIKEKTQTTSTGGGNGKKANPMSGSNKKKNPMQ